MRRTEQVQGLKLRLMKFEEIYERTTARPLRQHEAASILGVSERAFRRWRDRFEATGLLAWHAGYCCPTLPCPCCTLGAQLLYPATVG
ncbi:MAG: helix-turn-helix domain-containing protein [Rhodospirillaceae bacterium]|jgi:hypothetical protein|nr:helix-turn-helix domain-containing protein [Rhodospirillaceae bacterium]MBT4045658.1 helix-turn-helix domain-containing protein [Rhodospirillaceae bacterium]MBT4689919.1 helix-turn-helix domain-containing protein [Rhodospirillaceae bacterium]MBT5081972.1 helix-turn-helix domain-containing protein [Rhodospirillaceae bacterium]MBT5524820.1 helix-turn-helix domain-containing protein [Rhodospirillaceae bacterium]